MRRATKWIGSSIAVLVLLVAGVALWGTMLPREHEASRTAYVDAPPERVYALITEVELGPTWREGLERVELLGEVHGLPRWVEHGSFGALTMERIEARPHTRVVTRIVDTGEGFGGTWTFELAPSGAGTELTITEHGWVDSPIFRFLSAYVFGHDTTLNTYLRSAEQAFAG